jgi:hypothetical protein
MYGHFVNVTFAAMMCESLIFLSRTSMVDDRRGMLIMIRRLCLSVPCLVRLVLYNVPVPIA